MDWISVETTLPEFDEEVLAYHPNGYIIATLNSKLEWLNDELIQYDDIIYWQPLIPPKEML